MIDYIYLYRQWKYNTKLSQAERQFYYSLLDFPTFAKTYIKIRNKQRQIIPLNFNSVQKLVYPHLIKDNRLIILKYRQGGISTLIAGYFFWDTILFPNTTTLVIAHLNDSAKWLFSIVKRAYDNLPPELIDFLELYPKYNTKTELHFEKRDSKYSVGSTEGDYGRSMTINNLHLSEFAFWKTDKAENFPELLGAVPDNSGKLYIESTPNGLNAFYDKYIEAKDGESNFKPIFIPWFKHPEYKKKAWFGIEDLTPEEREIMETHKLTLEQIAWRRSKITDLKEKFWQEYPEDDESCFLQSSTNVFNANITESIRKQILAKEIKPKKIVKLSDLLNLPINGEFKVYDVPKPEKTYIISADPAGGEKESLRSDPTAIIVFEIGTPNRIVGVFNDKLKPTELSALLIKLGNMYNNAKIVVERNNHGELVLYNLSNGFILNGRQFPKYNRIYKESENRIGIRTTVGNKKTIIENLNEGIEKGLIEIPDLDILSEMDTFVEKRSISGKVIMEAQSGKHDDLVMAMAIGYYVISMSPNSINGGFKYYFL